MKQLEDYIESGWKLQLTLAGSDQGVQYKAWAYDHSDKELLALVGEGDSMNAMLRDLQECEEELYPHLANDDKNNVSNRIKKILMFFRISSKPKGIGTNG